MLDVRDTTAPTLRFGSPATEAPRLQPVRERLWWSEAEITGHDPQDPLDDGEGINGVGFLPVSRSAPSLLRGVLPAGLFYSQVGGVGGARQRVAVSWRLGMEGWLADIERFGVDAGDRACSRGEKEKAGQGVEGEGGEGGAAEEE